MKIRSGLCLAGVTGVIALVLFLATSSWQPPANPSGDAGHAKVLTEATDQAKELAPEPLRTLVSEATDPVDAPVEVIVIDAETRQRVGGAVVSHVPPGFSLGNLTPEQLELYSGDMEAFMTDCGRSVRCNVDGSTRIPRYAAVFPVMARAGSQRGTTEPQDDADVLVIMVSQVVDILVETVDPDGNPVQHVRVDAMPLARGIPQVLARRTIGTTNAHGNLRYCTAADHKKGPTGLWLYARVMADEHGPVVVDLNQPPAQPLRLVVPATGHVHVRLLDSRGGMLDPSMVARVHAELSGAPLDPVENRRYGRLDGEGWATFDGVVLDKDLFLRFPPLVDVAIPIAGPTASRRTATVTHRLGPDQPSVAGTLVGPDLKSIGNVDFSLFVQVGAEVIATTGGHTGADGTFVLFLPSSVAGRGGTTLRFGIEWNGLAPAREVSVQLGAALICRVELGVIEMPRRR